MLACYIHLEMLHRAVNCNTRTQQRRCCIQWQIGRYLQHKSGPPNPIINRHILNLMTSTQILIRPPDQEEWCQEFSYKFGLFIWTDWSRGPQVHKNQSNQKNKNYILLSADHNCGVPALRDSAIIVLVSVCPDLRLAILFKMLCASVAGLAWIHQASHSNNLPNLESFHLWANFCDLSHHLMSEQSRQKNFPINSPPIWWSELLSFNREEINLLIEA